MGTKDFCFFHAAYPCLRQSVAVAVMRCLRHAPLGHAASSCWLCTYVRGSGLFFLASSLAFLLFRGRLLLGPQSSVRRRVRLLPFSGGHFLPPCFLCQVFRQLAAATVLAILGECACFCSCGAFSHISPPPCASIGLELAFTQSSMTTMMAMIYP